MAKKIEKDQVWVIGALNGDYDYTKQLISRGKEIAKESNKKVVVLELEKKPQEILGQYTACGADLVLCYDKDEINIDMAKDIVELQFKKYEPFLAMGCANEKNRELMAGIATRLDLGLTAECIEINYDKEKQRIVFTRTAVNDSTIANIITTGNVIQLCTVKRNVFEEKETEEIVMEKIEMCQADCKSEMKKSIAKLLSKEEAKNETRQDNISSDIIVGIGRGAVSSINKIQKIAELLHARIGVTRSLVDEGIFKKEYQIGQSGNAISGKTYIAFGISGATQHVVGIKNVKQVIAINRDKAAPIFKVADIAVVAEIDGICNCMLELLTQNNEGAIW